MATATSKTKNNKKQVEIAIESDPNNSKTILDFINNELREYAVYDNSRSIPSVVDGLKTSQRKVIYTAFTLKKGVMIKTTALGAKASDLTHYKHGEASIVGTVIKLAQDYAGSNNYPLLEKDGQFGTAQYNQSSSPRYIHVSRNDAIDDMFDAHDREIVKYLKFDGESIEPEYYLPKLPLILINGSVGIGNGYSTKILTRDVSKVAEYVKSKIETGEANPDLLLPSFNGFNGRIEQVTQNSYKIYGKIERLTSTKFAITELPPFSSFQYENVKDRILIPMKLNGVISDFENESQDGKWNIIISHKREFGLKTDEEIIETLKLFEKSSENITAWGYDNRLKVFNSAQELADYWIDNRCGWYQVYKDHVLSKMKVKNAYQYNLLKLIEYWLANPSITSLKKGPLLDELSAIVDDKEHIAKFLDQNILSLTSERVAKLKKDISELLKEQRALEKKTKEDLFIQEVSKFVK